jgi:hypothetical protein
MRPWAGPIGFTGAASLVLAAVSLVSLAGAMVAGCGTRVAPALMAMEESRTGSAQRP